MSELSVPDKVHLPRLAISLRDLDRVDPLMKGKLLTGRLNLKQVIKAGREDEPSLEFICPLLEAALICDILRSEDRKYGDFPINIYLNRDESWVRLMSYTVLTIIVNGKVKLNPEVFSSLVKIESSAPPIKSLTSLQNGESNNANNPNQFTKGSKD